MNTCGTSEQVVKRDLAAGIQLSGLQIFAIAGSRAIRALN
jgi:hypothetical protein